MPSRLTGRKPGSVKFTVYSPARNATMLYFPASSVMVERTPPISAGLETSTVTPGRTAPDASLTTPVIELCANAEEVPAPMITTRITKRRTTNLWREFLFIMVLRGVGRSLCLDNWNRQEMAMLLLHLLYLGRENPQRRSYETPDRCDFSSATFRYRPRPGTDDHDSRQCRSGWKGWDTAQRCCGGAGIPDRSN